MKWKLDNHIRGKVYDLTQENMSALIADVEKWKKLAINGGLEHTDTAMKLDNAKSEIMLVKTNLTIAVEALDKVRCSCFLDSPKHTCMLWCARRMAQQALTAIRGEKS